jgi:LMBR1 domain-containing protein 1
MGESVVLIVFTTIIFILLFTSFQAVKFYIDPRFNDYLTTIISSICLMLVLSSIFLIPIDVYLAQSRNAVLAVDAVLGIYHFVFILLLMLYFIVLPFAYFYYDSPTDWSSRKKMNSASKYTFLSILLLVLLLIVGMLIEAFRYRGVTDAGGILLLFENKHFLVSTMEVCMGILFLSGNVGVMIYCSFGLAAMPILQFLKRCSDNLPYNDDPHFKGRNEIYRERSINLENKKKLWRKYRLTGRKMNRSQRMKYEEINERERLLKDREARLIPSKRKTYFSNLVQRHGWMKVIIGILLLLGSWNIVFSIIISIVDRFGQCESYLDCPTGYLMKQRNVESPMDWFLLFVSRFFPFDYIVLGIVVLYFLISAIHAMSSLGVRFLFFFSIYPLREKKTYPQGIILATANIILIMFAITFQMTYIAPQYISFGLQEYKAPDGTMLPCTLIMSVDSAIPTIQHIDTQHHDHIAKQHHHNHHHHNQFLNNHEQKQFFPTSMKLTNEPPPFPPPIFFVEIASNVKSNNITKLLIPKNNNATGGRIGDHSMKKTPAQCQPSPLSMIINGLMAKYKFFGIIFQYTEIGFVFFFIIFSIISIGRNPRKRWIDSDDLSDDDDIDEEIANAYFDDDDDDDDEEDEDGFGRI